MVEISWLWATQNDLHPLGKTTFGGSHIEDLSNKTTPTAEA